MLQHTELVLTQRHNVASMVDDSITPTSAIPTSNSTSSLPKSSNGHRASASGQGFTAQSSVESTTNGTSDFTWLTEMQREFNALVDIIIPLLALTTAGRTPDKFV